MIKYHEYDKHYKESLEELDKVKLDDYVEEAITAAEQVRVADGEDPLNDLEKENITKKAKFDALCKTFWSPEDAAAYKEMKEKEAEALAAE